jgi:hypothetical protein
VFPKENLLANQWYQIAVFAQGADDDDGGLT